MGLSDGCAPEQAVLRVGGGTCAVSYRRWLAARALGLSRQLVDGAPSGPGGEGVIRRCCGSAQVTPVGVPTWPRGEAPLGHARTGVCMRSRVSPKSSTDAPIALHTSDGSGTSALWLRGPDSPDSHVDTFDGVVYFATFQATACTSLLPVVVEEPTAMLPLMAVAWL